MGHKVNELILRKFGFTSIEVSGDSLIEKHISIDREVDKLFDNRLKEIEQKAIKGDPSALVMYNLLIKQDAYNRAETKRKFKEQLRMLEGDTFIRV